MIYSIIQTKYPDNNGRKRDCNMWLERTADINTVYKRLAEFVSMWLEYEFVVREDKQ